MKKRFTFLSIIVVIIVLFYFLSQVSFNSDTNQAKQAVYNYTKYLNNKNKSEFKKTISKSMFDESLEFENLKGIKLLWIREAPSSFRDSYMKTGLGKTEKPYEVKVFKIIIYKSYKKVGPENNGLHSKNIYVTKEQKNSPWLISAIGQG